MYCFPSLVHIDWIISWISGFKSGYWMYWVIREWVKVVLDLCVCVCVCVCVCLQEPLLFSLIHTAFLSLISCSSNVVRTVWRVFPKINLVVSWLLSSLKDLLTYCSSTCAVVFSFSSWSVYKGNYRTWSNGMHQVWRRCVNVRPLV